MQKTRASLKECDNELVKQFWKREASQAGGDYALNNMAPYITSKLSAFIYNDFIRAIIFQEKSDFNFRAIMDGGKIFLASLAKGVLGSNNTDMLGMLLLNQFFLSVLSRRDIEVDRRRRFTLYCDEFQNLDIIIMYFRSLFTI